VRNCRILRKLDRAIRSRNSFARRTFNDWEHYEASFDVTENVKISEKLLRSRSGALITRESVYYLSRECTQNVMCFILFRLLDPSFIKNVIKNVASSMNQRVNTRLPCHFIILQANDVSGQGKKGDDRRRNVYRRHFHAPHSPLLV
jgi:hypothetical protein